MKITLDNNCIINLFDANSPSATSVDELNELMQLALSSDAEIAITTRVEADLENDRNDARRTELLGRIKMFPVVGTVARWDVSKWDSGDVWGGYDTTRISDEIQKILFPGGLNTEASNFGNKLNDIDHLVGHKINERDVFVTDDKGILKKAEVLKTSPGIVVMNPGQCVELLKGHIETRKSKPLESERKAVGYENSSLDGEARFDYSNNDGRYTIGHGSFLFETMWTHADQVSIHVYNDPSSLSGVALAKGHEEISEIVDASEFDFTSRSRNVREGGVLVLQNQNGIFAAIKVIDVQYEDRGDEQDLLVFEYKIQHEGGGDFTKT
ncbi:hypothetical protein [Leisingera sp. ANG59]|uniref:hypothetical protein n=1 Tax=Leisingera sp. ANG59 TaxID=2675221 RepID=UPI0015728421|nr:hypothetical protein [Leisingera sp. ANG59]